MEDIKYFFKTDQKDEVFYTDKMASNFCIETIWVEGVDGFNLYLVDETLGIEMYFLTTVMTNFNLGIKISEGQNIKVVSRGNTQMEKILIQGKAY